MSTLTITNNFTNGTTADAEQVDANFTDVKTFVDSHLAHRGEHVPKILDRVRLTADSATANSATDVDILTGNAVTLVSGHYYEIAVSYQALHSTVASDLVQVSIKTGATVRHNWIGEASTTARGGVRNGTILACTAEIGAGSTTFKLSINRAAGTGTVKIQGAGTNPIMLAVIDWGEQ